MTRLGKVVGKLMRNDARLILRDSMLATLFVISLVMGLAARFALPAIDLSLRRNGVWDDFSSTFPVFVTFIALWQGALMPGTVFGFLLLDEKEDGTLSAMRVTPVPLEVNLGYRIALPAIIGLGFSLVLLPLIGHVTVAWWQAAVLALSACGTAPVATLAFAAFADNKVQGLAYTKFGGIAGLTILVGWFLPPTWQWAFAWFPPFLVSKACWMALESHPRWILVAALGLVGHVALAAILVRRFRSIAFG